MIQEERNEYDWTQLAKCIDNRDFEAAIQLIEDGQKSKELFGFLLSRYQQHADKQEQQYQNWIHTFAVSITPEAFHPQSAHIISQAFEHLCALASPKYTLIILKSLLHKIGSHDLGKLVLCSNFHRFYMLICDPVTADLADIYRQLEQSYGSLKKEKIEMEQKKEKCQFAALYYKSLETFLLNLLLCPIKINPNFTEQAIKMCCSIIKSIYGCQNPSEYMPNCNKQTLIDEVPLRIMAQLNYKITSQKTSILLTRAFLKTISKIEHPFGSNLFAPCTIALLLIRTINNQLRMDLTSPCKLIQFEEQFLCAALQHLCEEFTHQQQISQILIQNYPTIEQFIEKINIYLGSINPQDTLYKKLLKTFVNLPFLTPEAKERLYAKLIAKHTNESFKAHLMTQYRHLLNPSCSRTVWVRSTALLFKQLRQIKPNSNIDYIGHIISLAFFWKQLLKRFIKQENFAKTCFLNITAHKNQFQQHLKTLKQGLEVKVQLSQSQNNEAQRNQTNICLFRIAQIIEN